MSQISIGASVSARSSAAYAPSAIDSSIRSGSITPIRCISRRSCNAQNGPLLSAGAPLTAPRREPISQRPAASTGSAPSAAANHSAASDGSTGP